MSVDFSFLIGTAAVIGLGMWASSWANRRAARRNAKDGPDDYGVAGEGYDQGDDDAFEADGGSFGGGGASGDWGDDGDGDGGD